MFTLRVYGFNSLEEYYKYASSVNYVSNIKVPTFFLNSLDDPVCSYKAIPYEKFGAENENIFLGITKGGGHVGWYDCYGSLNQWFTKPLFSFFDSI